MSLSTVNASSRTDVTRCKMKLCGNSTLSAVASCSRYTHHMCKPHSRFATGLMTVSLLAATVLTGCAAHVGVGYRVYDPYYGDYHVWNDAEVGYYNQWTVETHRPHRDYRKLR